jgi:hypothetical protein
MGYCELQQRLDTGALSNISQQPMILGDGSATLGGVNSSSSFAAFISVSRVDQDEITLDKGTAAGVSVGDEYEFSPLSSALATSNAGAISVDAVISSVRGLTSTVQKEDVSGDIALIRVGWIGRLKRKVWS